MIRVLPFGAFAGFSDVDRPGASYYTQGFSQSALGMGTLYSLVNKLSSSVTGMGNITYFANANGVIYAIDDGGNILKEGTPGVYDFSIVHSPGGNGAGLVGDQFGNLLYSAGSSNDQLGLYDGSSWNDSLQSLVAGAHPMDTYEDLRLIGNGNGVACLFSDGSFNSAALSLPAGMTVTCLRSGPTGILIGANFGYQAALILWDGNLPRAKTPWKWVNGKVLSIDRYGANWIVKTTRGAYLTNGYTIKTLFTVMDDSLSFKAYDAGNVRAQQILVVGDMIIFNVTKLSVSMSFELGRAKPGLYIYHILTGCWDYIPSGTGNSFTLEMNTAFADASFNNRILVGYRDQNLGVNYIASLQPGSSNTATLITELLGIGKPKYQRVFFGPTDKIASAVILNLSMLSFITDPATISFDCSLKIYDFKRQLWGHQLTTATTAGNAIRVDGTDATFTAAEVGDEITILEGTNAGLTAHITAIVNQGTNTEEWTLDTTFPHTTASSVNINVQPWKFVETKTFTSLDQLKTIYFDLKDSISAKQFLLKFVFSNFGTNMQIEINTSYFVWDDIGYDQSDDLDS